MVRPSLALARSLLARRAALGAALALAALGLAGGLVPLLDVPGYELGLLGGWIGLALAGPLGLAAAREERARPGGSPAVAALAAALASSVLLALLLGATALRAALGPCRALFGAPFFPVLALPPAWLAAAVAAAAGWASRGRALPTGLALAAAVGASAAATLHGAFRGPAAFALDHLLGVWPGPLYDEALRLDARLLLFRGETAAPASAAECEFHAADVAAALGLAAPPHVTVFVHRSDEEKRRHVGAGATSFTKPWLREIHVTDAALPHPVLRHELVHAVAAALDPGWLGVPARRGVLVSMGLVEGLAVALDLPRGRWTAHQWARAAKALGLLPDVAGALGPAGFWRAAPARAYGAAGSFLAWLLERKGAARVAALYRTGDFERSLGAPAEALVGEWNAFLDGLALPPPLERAARARFARPPLFAVPCAREVAALEERALADGWAGRTAQACEALRRVAGLTGRAGPLREAGDLLARAGDLDGAAAAYRDALRAAPAEDLAARAALAAAEADLDWRRDAPGAAAAGWARALAAGPDRPEERLLSAKLAAVRDRTLAAAARPWLLGLEPPDAALARLAPLDEPLAQYLVGRVLLARGEWGRALPALERAAAGALPPVLADEARFLVAEGRCAAGRPAEGEPVLARLAAEAPVEADRARAAAGVRRCRFERARLAPPAGAAADP